MTAPDHTGTTAVQFAATLVDEWIRAGVTDAVLAPGSRSTPLTIACCEAEALTVHMVLDERSAGFYALGLSLASGRPTILGCTSGTAATHFHGAVVEAFQAGVPLLVCTADRPPELQDVGAPQTIDQVGLFHKAVRWSANPGVPDATTSSTWRSLASRAYLEATGVRPGPVHLNVMFREPLLDAARAALPPGRPNQRPWHAATNAVVVHEDAALEAVFAAAQRPLVIAGRDAPAGLHLTNVPVLGDPRSTLPINVAHAESLARDQDFCASHEPDVIVLAGEVTTAKSLHAWLGASSATKVALLPRRGWVNPGHDADFVVTGDINAQLTGDATWFQQWHEAGQRAAHATATYLDAITDALVEPAIARRVAAAVPPGGVLFVSSSMPIRDVEWFAEPRQEITVLANRGANGIDGIISTATGVAFAAQTPTVLLTGDLAFLHDSNGLLGLCERSVNLTIVVVDNRGGGIFAFLPQRTLLASTVFTQAFTTPQPVDLAALARAHNLDVATVDTPDALNAALDAAVQRAGVQVIIATTDPTGNVSTHNALHRAVHDALA